MSDPPRAYSVYRVFLTRPDGGQEEVPAQNVTVTEDGATLQLSADSPTLAYLIETQRLVKPPAWLDLSRLPVSVPDPEPAPAPSARRPARRRFPVPR